MAHAGSPPVRCCHRRRRGGRRGKGPLRPVNVQTRHTELARSRRSCARVVAVRRLEIGRQPVDTAVTCSHSAPILYDEYCVCVILVTWQLFFLIITFPLSQCQSHTRSCTLSGSTGLEIVRALPLRIHYRSYIFAPFSFIQFDNSP